MELSSARLSIFFAENSLRLCYRNFDRALLCRANYFVYDMVQKAIDTLCKILHFSMLNKTRLRLRAGENAIVCVSFCIFVAQCICIDTLKVIRMHAILYLRNIFSGYELRFENSVEFETFLVSV